MLKKVPDDQKKVSREGVNSEASNRLEISDNKEFQFIENVEVF